MWHFLPQSVSAETNICSCDLSAPPLLDSGKVASSTLNIKKKRQLKKNEWEFIQSMLNLNIWLQATQSSQSPGYKTCICRALYCTCINFKHLGFALFGHGSGSKNIFNSAKITMKSLNICLCLFWRGSLDLCAFFPNLSLSADTSDPSMSDR